MGDDFFGTTEGFGASLVQGRDVILEPDVAIEGGFLEAPDSKLAPARGDHGFDQHGFGGRGGLEFIEQLMYKIHEAVSTFDFQHEGFGEQSVADAVAGGVLFALRGDRPAGACSIGLGGLNLFFRAHIRFKYPGRGRIGGRVFMGCCCGERR